MGGPGSGNRYSRWAKPSTAGQRRLDVRALARAGRLAGGTRCLWAWDDGALIGIAVADCAAGAERPVAVLLDYRYRRDGGAWEDVRQTIPLDWTPCAYGGARPWFVCPGCSRRAAVLWGAGRRFLCRGCHSLAYQSTRQDRRDRQLGRAQAIRRRLGGSPSLLVPFPPKPPRQHRRTYMRLFLAHQSAEFAYHVETMCDLDRLRRWLERIERGG